MLLLTNNGHPELPKDAKVLLRTPRTVNILSKFRGEYIYFETNSNLFRVM